MTHLEQDALSYKASLVLEGPLVLLEESCTKINYSWLLLPFKEKAW